MSDLRAPFPWFGGKSRVAPMVWDRFGDVRNYVEPFAGSLAVLLGRPTVAGVETVNDKDAYIANFWRALQADPSAVAHYADWPVNETDLHARHQWLVTHGAARLQRMQDDPEYFDAQVAGWWVWGICAWIGSGWCKPIGARHANGTRKAVDWKQRPDLSSPNGRGMLTTGKVPNLGTKGTGVHRKEHPQDVSNHNLWKKRPDLANPGKGIHAEGIAETDADEIRLPRRVKMGKAGGVNSARIVGHKRPALTGNGPGVGVHRSSLTQVQLPQLSGDGSGSGRGILRDGLEEMGGIEAYMHLLAERLRRTRVTCGDWTRIVGPAVTTCIGTTGVFLDPPYPAPGHERSYCYNHDDNAVWFEARDWAVANADNPQLRIALCGYDTHFGDMPGGTMVAWKASGGYGRSDRGRENAARERIWFSPNCLNPLDAHPDLFAQEAG